MNLRQLLVTTTSLVLTMLLSASAHAQHSHGILTPPGPRRREDAGIIDPPKKRTISCRVDVRLLKLDVYTAEEKWINIGFQYDPSRHGHSFVYLIPFELPASDYYIARWAVTDERRRLINGEFKFAFGAGALPPSEIIAARVSDLEEVLPATGSYR